MPVSRTALACLALTLASAACDKSSKDGASAEPSATPSAATTDSAPATAETARSAAASADPQPSATASAAPSAEAVASAAAPSPAAAPQAKGEPTCGTKPLPDCPLQGWMKANTNPAVSAGDLPALATALDKIVTFAPPGYTNWASISKDGAKAARDGDLKGAKASCRSCHEQYKSKYKAELRDRKI